MKVATVAVTLDLRFCGIVITDIAKIAAKTQDDPIKSHMNRHTEEESWERINIETPLGLAMSQVVEMKTVTGIEIEFNCRAPDRICTGRLYGVLREAFL